MNRLRIGFFLTMLIGTMWAAVGLLDSLAQFAVGVIIACVGVIGHGLVDFIDARHDDRILRERIAVWERRDR